LRRSDSIESRVVWDCNSKKGFSSLPKLNIEEIPIANKYCEGKVKSTLKKELKEHENVMKELDITCIRHCLGVEM